jgi:GTP-binding protein
VAADIPGIIEGAADGAGLGLQFLRHVERTRVLVHVVDASGTSGRDPVADLRLVREEVGRWDASLLERPQVVAASKRDVAATGADDPLPSLQAEALRLGMEIIPVSAVRGDGLVELKRALARLVREAAAVPVLEEQH